MGVKDENRWDGYDWSVICSYAKNSQNPEILDSLVKAYPNNSTICELVSNNSFTGEKTRKVLSKNKSVIVRMNIAHYAEKITDLETLVCLATDKELLIQKEIAKRTSNAIAQRTLLITSMNSSDKVKNEIAEVCLKKIEDDKLIYNVIKKITSNFKRFTKTLLLNTHLKEEHLSAFINESKTLNEAEVSLIRKHPSYSQRMETLISSKM